MFEDSSHTPKKHVSKNANAARPSRIAVLIPNRGPYAAPAYSIRQGILRAQDNDHRGRQVRIRFYDTENGQPINNTYNQAIQDGADFVIGPLTKPNVTALLRSSTISVPTLALNYTDSRHPAQYYEIGLLPEDEVDQLIKEARKKGLSRALLIAPQSTFGTRLSKPLVSRWQAQGGQLIDTLYFTPRTNFKEAVARLLRINIAEDNALMRSGDRNKTRLENQRRSDFDVIFLIASPQEGRTIVPLLRYYYVDTTPIYAPSSIYAERDPVNDVDLNNIYICDMPASMQGDQAALQTNHRFYALGQDAYLLSQSLKQLEETSGLTLPGETGELSINNKRQIHRDINCGVVRNGYLSPT
jgi:outer membrane PBP1 activator LpoA protein